MAGGRAPGGPAEPDTQNVGAEGGGPGDPHWRPASPHPPAFLRPLIPSFPLTASIYQDQASSLMTRGVNLPLHTQHQDTDDTADTHTAGTVLSAHPALTLRQPHA